MLAALTTKKRVVPTMMKLITALKKLPYAIPFHDNLERFSTLAALTTGLRISGVMISPTSEVIIALKARSYGVILPSSLTMLLPPALGFSPHPPVSVCGTG